MSASMSRFVSPPGREAPFSDVTPMWSSLDVSKLASPLFASSAWQPPATESRARAAWRDMQTRATDAVRRHRAWFVGAAIATFGAVGTCALVTAVRTPNAEGANASMVAPRPSEPRQEAAEMPATEPSAEGAVANEGTPANEAPIRTARKGTPRDKTVEPPSPKVPAGSRRAPLRADPTRRRRTRPPASFPPPLAQRRRHRSRRPASSPLRSRRRFPVSKRPTSSTEPPRWRRCATPAMPRAPAWRAA